MVVSQQREVRTRCSAETNARGERGAVLLAAAAHLSIPSRSYPRLLKGSDSVLSSSSCRSASASSCAARKSKPPYLASLSKGHERASDR